MARDPLFYDDPIADALAISELDSYANRLPTPAPAEDPARRIARNMLGIPAAWAGAGLKKTLGLPEAAREAAVDTGRALGNVGRTNPDSDPKAVEDAMKLAGLVGGPQTAFAMAGPRSAEVAGIFGGLRAATKDLDALKYAKELEAAAWDAPAIWRETGWGRDKSGNWMFEIDDSGMKLVPIRPGSDQYRIEHPEFEKAYPGMLATINQEIHARPLQSSTRGYWDAGNRKLVATDPDPELLRETVLHELNHAAQSAEGFARGTSPQSAEVAAVRQRIPKEEIETARNRAYETLGEFENIFRKNFDAQGGPKWDEVDPRTKQRFREEHFKQWPGDQPEYDRAFDTVSNGPLSPYSLHNIYRREAGEVASRNTEARADFPAELRRKWDPWSTQDVPDVDQYVLPSRQHFSWSDDGTTNPGGAAPGVSASMVYKPGDKLAPAGSGYVSVPGKPSTVDIPGVGTVEARPIGAIEDAASSYMRGAGRPGEHRIEAFSPFSEDRARKIAEAFEAMRHNPGDPATRRSYEAMIDETLAQYKSLKDAGIDFRFMREGDTDPYARSPSQGYKDMVENGRLTVFPTDFGFGTNAAFDPKDNPLLKRVGRVGDKDDAVANDAFRAVHDAYGHFGPGNPFFRHKGEERAWEAHSKMYSPEAVPAMSTETRGQNSWLNFGPHAEHNKTALGADTIFADQKIGLLPMWAYATGKTGFADGGAVMGSYDPRAEEIAGALEAAKRPVDDVRALEQFAGERAAEETAARARERRVAAYPAVIPALIPPMAVVNAAKGARELVGAIGRLGREEPTVEDALTIAGAATTGGFAAGARPRPGVVSMSGAAERQTAGAADDALAAARKPVEFPVAARAEPSAPIGDGSRVAPVRVEAPEHVDVAAARVTPEPSDAQKAAGNYTKGHVKIAGFDVSIETPKGGVRSGVAPDGSTWTTEMPAHYGYIKRTAGADGDQLDVYVGPKTDSDRVFVVDQYDPATGKFDEHKAILGAGSLDEARALYDGGFSDGSGAERRGHVREMPLDEFRSWVKSGDLTKPAAPGNDAMRISTRYVTSKKSDADPTDPSFVIDTEASKASPKAYEANADLLRSYPNMRLDQAGGAHDDVVRNFQQHVKENLLWLHDQVPAEIRDRSKRWYDGARNLTDRWSKDYDLPDASIAGALAALSPQKDWFQNVSLAQRVLDIHTGQRKTLFSPEMSATADRIFAKPEFEGLREFMRGKTYAQMETPEQKAFWLRVYDQTHNSPEHRLLTPEGDFGDVVRSGNGQPTRVAWGSLGEIAKAIEAVEARGDRRRIGELMGERHKVRSFYNNIVAPNSRAGDVTIDTHAVAAGLLRALSGNSLEVAHNFGNYAGKGLPQAKGSAISGAQGLYGIYADAYRQAAKERGILPREMQSITWEAVRGLFSPKFKANAKNVQLVDDIWNRYRAGELSIDDARRMTHDAAGGIEAPDWWGSGQPAARADGGAVDAGELAADGLSGRAAGTVDARARGGTAEAAPGLEQVRRADGGRVNNPYILEQVMRLRQGSGGAR